MRGFLFLCGLALIIGGAYASNPPSLPAAETIHYPSNVYRVAFDSSADSFLRDETRDAVLDWERKTPGLIFEMVDEPCHDKNCIVIVSVTTQYLNQEHGPAPGPDRFIGWCDRDSTPTKIEIADDAMFTKDYAIRHELGHALGLGHGDIDTVMNYHANQGATTVKCADVRAYFNLLGSRMPRCEDTP